MRRVLMLSKDKKCRSWKNVRKKMEKDKLNRQAKIGEAQRRALVLYEREMKMKNDRANEEHREYLKTQVKEQQVK